MRFDVFENIQSIYHRIEYDQNNVPLVIFLFLYIDDILIATNDILLAAEIKNCLCKKYIIKDLRLVDQFLCIKIN